MKGTERQVAWAEQIKERMLSYCNRQITEREKETNYLKNDGKIELAEQAEKIKRAWIKIIDKINMVDDAKWFIDNRNNLSFQAKFNTWVEKEAFKLIINKRRYKTNEII